MTPVDLADPEQRGRLCRRCDVVVRDLSSMTEANARALLAATDGRLCVRYLFDAQGQVVFGGAWPEGAKIVPQSRLTARWKASIAGAAIVATPMLFEACGGIGPYDGRTMNPPYEVDAGADAHVDASPTDDAGASDAGPSETGLQTETGHPKQ